MARVYHSGQAGIPAPQPTRFNSYMLEVLKACLVYGYGTQEAAGWALVDEAAAYIVLRNATENGYLCLYLDNQVITISMSETYTGVSGALITGGGAISGVAANSAIPHRITRQYFGYGGAGESWFVVADGATAIFGFATNASGGAVDLGSANSGYPVGVLYLGDDSAGNFIATGGYTSASNSAQSADYIRIGSGMTALRNPSTGLLIAPGGLTFSHLGFAAVAASSAGPAAPIPSLSLEPGMWEAYGVFAKLRGIARNAVLASYSTSALGKAIGITAGVTTGSVNVTADLGDGHSYFPGPVYRTSGQGFLVTDNPEFW